MYWGSLSVESSSPSLPRPWLIASGSPKFGPLGFRPAFCIDLLYNSGLLGQSLQVQKKLNASKR